MSHDMSDISDDRVRELAQALLDHLAGQSAPVVYPELLKALVQKPKNTEMNLRAAIQWARDHNLVRVSTNPIGYVLV